MSGDVRGNPAALRALRSDIDRSQKEIQTAISRLRGSLRRVEWHDAVRQRFEQELEQVLRSASKFDGQADAMKSTLERKARELDIYNSH